VTYSRRRLAFPTIQRDCCFRLGRIAIDLDDLFETGLKCGYQFFASTTVDVLVNVREHLPSCGDDPAALLIDQSGTLQYAEQTAKQKLRLRLQRHMEGFRFTAERQHATRNVDSDVGNERIARILQRFVAVGDPVDAGIGPVLPRHGWPAPYPAAFEFVQQAAGCARDFLAATTADPLYRDCQGIILLRYGSIFRGANAESGSIRVGATQCIEHHFAFGLLARRVVKCQAQEQWIRRAGITSATQFKQVGDPQW
jgi:hypothetical protein